MSPGFSGITINGFMRGEITRDRLSVVIDRSFRGINLRRRELFSRQNGDWTIAQARQRIAEQRVSLSSDHAGFHALRFTLQVLQELDVSVRNFGPNQALLDAMGGLDHPTMVVPAIESVTSGKSTRAILCCGSGTGVLIDANMMGLPAVKAVSPINVVRGREHNNARVLTIGERMVANREVKVIDVVKSIILFLSTPFIKEPARYGDRNRQMGLLHSLVPAARALGLSSVADLPGFSSVLRMCPEIADIHVIRAHEALRSGELVLAARFITRYLNEGSRSKNYFAFLASFSSVLPEQSSCSELSAVAVRIAEILATRV